MLADLLSRGAANLLKREWKSPEDFERWLYRAALARDPTPQELAAAREAMGERLTPQSVEDALWAVLMLPEFEMVR